MAESSWPTIAGGRAVDDTQWERIAAGFACDGILGLATDTPVVYADGSGMLVKIRADKAGMVRGHGWYSGTVEFTLTVGANASGSTRIDLVILQFTRSTQEVHIVVKAGAPGSGAPVLTQNAVGSGIWEIAIAQVTVVSGATNIGSGNVATVARYVNSATGNARPAWLRHMNGLLTASDRSGSTSVAVGGTWGNTAAPTADGPAPAPPFYGGSELNVVKTSGASRLMCTITLSGWGNNHGVQLNVGIRIGGVNYPMIYHYFNIPMTVNTEQPTYTRGGPGVGGTNTDHQAIATLTAPSDHTGTEYPGNWAPGTHSHSSAPHYHPVTVTPQHLSLTGWNVVGGGLAPGNYKAWMYVAVNGSFIMDYNDSLHIKFEEIDT